MEKAIVIKLNKNIINIEENAFNELNGYLSDIEAQLDNKTAIKTIEVEFSRYLLFLMKNDNRDTIILSDITLLKQKYGSADDIKNSKLAKPSSLFKKFINKDQGKSDANKVIGGVCLKISNYLDLNTFIIRLCFVIAFYYYFSVLGIYFLLWMFLPEKQHYSSFEQKNKDNHNLLGRITDIAAFLIKIPIKLIVILLGIFISTFAIAIVLGVSLSSITAAFFSLLDFIYQPFTLFNNTYNLWLIFSILSIICISIAFFIIVITKLLLHKDIFSDNTSIVMAILFILSIIMFIYNMQEPNIKPNNEDTQMIINTL